MPGVQRACWSRATTIGVAILATAGAAASWCICSERWHDRRRRTGPPPAAALPGVTVEASSPCTDRKSADGGHR